MFELGDKVIVVWNGARFNCTVVPGDGANIKESFNNIIIFNSPGAWWYEYQLQPMKHCQNTYLVVT